MPKNTTQPNTAGSLRSPALQTPKLRFPGFEGAWEEKKLKDVSIRIGDGIHTTPVYDEDGEYYFINGNNLVDGKIEINENTKKVNLKEFEKHKRDLGLDTILISINGTIGNVSYYNNENVILGKSAAYLNLQQNFNKNFIFNILKTDKIQKHFISELTGSTIKNLSLKSINNTKFLIPQLPEQQKIASFLGSVDEWLENLRTQKQNLEQYKKGIMQQIFSQKIRFKDENGNNFPDWEEKRLGEICEMKNGYSFESSEYDDGGGFKIITIGNVQNGVLDVGKVNRIKFLPNDIQKHQILNFSDLLISMTGNVGRMCLVNEDNCLLNQRVGKLIPDVKVLNLNFLFQKLNTREFEFKMQSLAQGGAQGNISKGDILGYILQLPSLSEQQKIAEFLSSVDDLIESKQQQITQAEVWKKGLMQGLFV